MRYGQDVRQVLGMKQQCFLAVLPGSASWQLLARPSSHSQDPLFSPHMWRRLDKVPHSNIAWFTFLQWVSVPLYPPQLSVGFYVHPFSLVFHSATLSLKLNIRQSPPIHTARTISHCTTFYNIIIIFDTELRQKRNFEHEK